MANKGGTNKWLMLFLVIVIGITTYLQQFCTPVMLPLIGHDLGLSTAQLGMVWGMATFGGLFLSVPGGLLGDKVGPKWGIFIISVIVVVTLGLRGLAREPVFLSVMMFFGGGIIGALPSVAAKAIFIWFPPGSAGSANGIWWSFNRVGMAAGAAVTSTLVMPALHGWQNTFFLYGGILLLCALVWILVIKEPAGAQVSARAPFAESIRQTVRNRDVWLCSITLFGIIGCFVSFVGYLPLYLQNSGWTEVSSSLSLTTFLLLMMISSLTIPVLSDRVGRRKIFCIVPCLIFITQIFLMAVFKKTSAVWTIIVISGLSFGCLMPVVNAMIAEIKGIGARYAGTAIGLGSGLGGLGGLVFAWAAGILAEINPAAPFVFCAGLFFLCLIPFFFTKETGHKLAYNAKAKSQKQS